MLNNQSLLNTLTSPRLRQHYDLRDSEEDQSPQMLNAIGPGAVMPMGQYRYDVWRSAR